MAARILILDPSPEIRELIGRVVERLGHTPLYAAWPSHERVPECELALVEPAFEECPAAVRRLRQAQPELPIVCVSIYPKSDPAVSALEPAAYLMKPFSLGELAATLGAVLGDAVASAAA
jgi:DNA-binding response OmpR family regulator